MSNYYDPKFRHQLLLNAGICQGFKCQVLGPYGRMPSVKEFEGGQVVGEARVKTYSMTFGVYRLLGVSSIRERDLTLCGWAEANRPMELGMCVDPGTPFFCPETEARELLWYLAQNSNVADFLRQSHRETGCRDQILLEVPFLSKQMPGGPMPVCWQAPLCLTWLREK